MRALLLIISLVLVSCTHASVSSIPMEVPGVGTVYRYQGRANFAHQIAEADRLMTEHCLKINGGRPVIVSHEKVDLGTVSYGSAQANTTGSAVVTGSSNSAVATGSSATTVTGSNTNLRNYNQEILYKCVQS